MGEKNRGYRLWNKGLNFFFWFENNGVCKNKFGLRGLKKSRKNLRDPKNFPEKIRGLKKIGVFWKNAPSGYPEEKMTDPYDYRRGRSFETGDKAYW